MNTNYFNHLFFGCLATFVFTTEVLSQSSPPESISYQGIARDASGDVLSNYTISIQFIIHQGSANGGTVFTEQHYSVPTNSLGLFTLQIGSVNTSAFSSINWANGPYYLEVQMDPNGGTSYTSVGTQQMLSVPYSLYSKKSVYADSLNLPPLSVAPFWRTKGNYYINPSQHFLGTIDTSSLIFKTNNIKRMSINSQGKVTVGNYSPNNPLLFNVMGGSSDTIVALFSNTSPVGTGLAVYNQNLSALVLLNNQDSLFVDINPSKSEVFSTNKLNIFSLDTLTIAGSKRLELGSSKDIFVYTPDSVHFLAKTRFQYSTPLSSINKDAMTIDFFNNNSIYSSGLKINHIANITSPGIASYGIYINNSNGTANSGKMVGMGVYNNSGGGQKRGIDISMTNQGTNIAAFLDAGSGNVSIDGYSDWSIYSNSGNVMIKDGHIKASTSSAPPSVVISSTCATVSASSAIPPISDIRGTIDVNISSSFNIGCYFTITVPFQKPYFNTPAVVISKAGNNSYLKNVDVYVGNVTSNNFEIIVINNTSVTLPSLNFKINYFVIE
ncbi:MAG TPA: hypothetical protein PK995_00930 [Bacteroidia bacterium]|nr:hypothetical protein [Bacteroidia bacterium]